MIRMQVFISLLVSLSMAMSWWACDKDPKTMVEDSITGDPMEEQLSPDSQAVVSNVEVSGNEGSYSFLVTLKSPDEGCNQYADWWEVLTLDSLLVYRRILAHSHVGEQPFSRSGGAVSVDANQTIIVRGHMNNLGYGTHVQKGSVAEGFVSDTLPYRFATGLAEQEPQPQGCAF